MERHFALPIAITAALHAGLLFGFHPPTIPHRSPAADKPPPLKPMPPIEVDLAPPDPTTDNTAPAKGNPDASRPVSPEPPAVDPKPGFEIDVPKSPPLRPDQDPIVIIGLPAGAKNGSDDGVSLKPGRIFNGGDLDSTPRARLQVPPQYPHEARRNGTRGEVHVEFVVDESGAVVSPRVVRSNDRAFDEPTLRAVARWRFEPGKRDGRIVRFRMVVPVIFTLDRD